MAVTTDDLAKIQRAVMNREEFETTGLKKTAPLYEAYLEMQEQYSTAPEGTMVEVIEDLPWGKFDALIAASSKASGIDYMKL